MNMAMPVGSVGVSDQALPRRDLFKTSFYNDWLRHQDNVVAGPFLLCERTPHSFVGIAVACHARNVEETLPKAQRLSHSLPRM